MKKIISVILALAMVFSVCVMSVSAAGTKTTCGEDCDKTPTIIVHGIGQSNVWYVDENGDYVLDDDGEKIDCFPCYADVWGIVKEVLAPVLLTLAFQRNIGLSSALEKVVDLIFCMNECDNEGNESKYCVLEEYPYSLAECSQEEKDTIYDNVPVEDLAADIGEDHLYYFAYNSFGNTVQTVDRLYKYIEMVKEETGHDKVNICAISMGGAISNGLLEWYNGTYEGRPDVYDSINKLVYIVPALNGSSIIGDVMTKNITFLDAEYLYNGFLEGLMDESTARWIEVALRILPDDVIEEVLSDTVDALDEKVFSKCTNMWALCPKEDYQKAAEMWLSDPSVAAIKEQTDMFYTAQCNQQKNVARLQSMGVKVFDIVDYDYPLYNIGNSWNDENGDGIIGLSSTSMGATAAKVGETLPEGYTQQGTYCTDPENHNHISKDNVVDASTGYLCETTFYFDGQGHEKTARNDIIMKLAVNLLSCDDIENVYTDPNFPQFNGGRDYRDLKNHLEIASNVDTSKLTSDQATRLAAAVKEGQETLDSTVEEPGHIDEVDAKLLAVLVEIGAAEPEDESTSDASTPEKISLWLLDKFGTNGFSEYPLYLLKAFISLFTK